MEVHHTALLQRLFWNTVPGHTTRVQPVGFEQENNSIQFYAIANLHKTFVIMSNYEAIITVILGNNVVV